MGLDSLVNNLQAFCQLSNGPSPNAESCAFNRYCRDELCTTMYTGCKAFSTHKQTYCIVFAAFPNKASFGKISISPSHADVHLTAT